MKLFAWIALVALAAFNASAAPLVLPDVYGGQFPGAAANNGDVKGLLSFFDIEKLVVDTTSFAPGGVVTISVFLNINGGVASSAGGYLTQGMTVGGGFPTLYAADVLITNGVNKWAIPLTTHALAPGQGADTMTPGKLYSVAAYKDSASVVGVIPGGNYNPANNVWGNFVGAVDLTAANVGAVSALGGSQFKVDMAFITNGSASATAFMAALGSGVTTYEFNAATCANDLLNAGGGAPPGVPEPATFALLGFGLAGLGLYRRRAANR